MATIISDRRITTRKVESENDRIKGNIRDAYQAMKANYDRYNYWHRFIYQSSLSNADVSLAQELQRTQLEFNILEAYVSRLCGEFSLQEPSPIVRESDNPSKHVPPQVLEVVSGYLRAVIDDSNRDNLMYTLFRDMLSGGFSALKVMTEYSSSMSFHQNIVWQRPFDPTMCGWDRLARDSHKGDGRFCFETFPKTREEFESEYGTELTQKMSFVRNIEGFNWSYESDHEDILLIADYYEKKKKKAKIVQLLDGSVKTVDDYERMLEAWSKDPSKMIQAPAVVGKPRTTEIVTICRHRLVETGTLEYVDTDFEYLPIIFFDGNSVMIRSATEGQASQITRPYPYHAEGIQKLKNYAGNSLATELENTVMHKWIAMKEAIPEEFTEAYINPQKASILIYNGFKDNDASVPLAPPQAVQRTPIPPEITNTFSMSDEMTQVILGSYDAALGINDNQLSGKAINAGSKNANAASKPFMVGFMKGFNRALQLTVSLVPKYMDMPRNIPYQDISGKRSNIRVNDGEVSLDFDANSIEIRVESGVNFEIQRTEALQSLTQLMQISPILQEFIGTEEAGLQMLLDNVDIRGIDALKEQITPFIQQVKQRQQMAQQQQMQAAQMSQVPLQLKQIEIQMKQQEMEQKAQKAKLDALLETADLQIKQADSDTRRMVAMATIGEKIDRLELEGDQLDVEKSRNAVAAVNAETNAVDTAHRHAMDVLDLHHTNTRHSKDLEHAVNLAKESAKVMPVK